MPRGSGEAGPAGFRGRGPRDLAILIARRRPIVEKRARAQKNTVECDTLVVTATAYVLVGSVQGTSVIVAARGKRTEDRAQEAYRGTNPSRVLPCKWICSDQGRHRQELGADEQTVVRTSRGRGSEPPARRFRRMDESPGFRAGHAGRKCPAGQRKTPIRRPDNQRTGIFRSRDGVHDGHERLQAPKWKNVSHLERGARGPPGTRVREGGRRRGVRDRPDTRRTHCPVKPRELWLTARVAIPIVKSASAGEYRPIERRTISRVGCVPGP